MAIRFRCETCNRPINVKNRLAGQEGVCPHCREVILVPGATRLSEQEFLEARTEWEDRQSGRQPVVTRPDPATPDPHSEPETTLPEPPGIGVATGEGERSGKPAAVSPDVRIEIGTAGRPTGDPFSDAPRAMWYVRPPGGGQFGPASANLFRQWIREERVTGESWIWRQGWEEWEPAHLHFPDLVMAGGGPAIDPDRSLSSPLSQTRTAYNQARRRRTMWASIGLLAGTLVVGALIFLLVYIVQRQGGL